MKVYTVFSRPDNLDDEGGLFFIKEGFSWMAFFFTIFWALKKRIWPLFFLTIGIFCSLGILVIVLKIGVLDGLVVFVWFSFVFGHFAYDIERWWLVHKGFKFSGLIMGKNNEVALAGFFEQKTNPVT